MFHWILHSYHGRPSESPTKLSLKSRKFTGYFIFLLFTGPITFLGYGWHGLRKLRWGILRIELEFMFALLFILIAFNWQNWPILCRERRSCWKNNTDKLFFLIISWVLMGLPLGVHFVIENLLPTLLVRSFIIICILFSQLG